MENLGMSAKQQSPGFCSIENLEEEALALPSRKSPEWIPIDFDLTDLQQRIVGLLSKSLVGITTLVVTDIDRTLMKTEHPIFYYKENLASGKKEYVVDPARPSQLLTIPWGANNEHIRREAALKAKYGEKLWDKFDLAASGDINLTYMTPEIPEGISLIKQKQGNPATGVVAVTARVPDSGLDGCIKYLDKRGIQLCGLIGSSNDRHLDALGITKDTFASGVQRKVLVMIGLIQAAGPALHDAVIVEDSVEVLKLAAEVLPLMFPKIALSLLEVVHIGSKEHRVQEFLHYKEGEWISFNGERLSLGNIRKLKTRSLDYYDPSIE